RQELLLGEAMAPLVRDVFVLRSVGFIQVKGKSRPVEVFAVIEERRVDVAEPEWLRHYEEGIRRYRRREFALASESFAESLRLLPGDFLSEEYLQRSRDYQANPPPPEW